MENQRERERFKKPAFTVRHVVVLLAWQTTGSPLAGLGMHAERVKKSDPTGCVVLR